ncbi:uncharacterized protein PHACADRAFT_266237 [Phanerochaete carnosa HHB-10118-sp]|uniref:Uncharacterized protein n=1 Tax=Phanerochaete carnosa (strain HHB-10118-sp) TaxID=650164 RepID=K5WEP0_PHACS|nr:uncharacterized protein PHACADRAFT_266237 [Phanerochaete carnosa HHB-10118-sp]EKM48642.1 hypothetical protein PHACADRAFT_266237 [Phanerochaete carnosa HHB-10118-sp]
MSHAPTWEPSYPSTQHSHHDDDSDEDVKVPYDDLIDQYATPFSQNERHKVHKVEPLAFDQKTDATGKDLEGASSDGHDWAYPPASTAKEKEQRKPLTWSTFIPDSIACRLYLLTVLVETAIDLAIEADLLIRFHDFDKEDLDTDIVSRKMPVYLTIFALAHVFQFVLAVDAVAARNTLQFIFLSIFNALFLVYAVIQIKEIQQSLPSGTTGISHIPIDTLTLIIPIVISVAELAYCALGWRIYTEFGWKVYKYLGADRRIKTMYAHYQIFLCLVKFDLFFWVGFSVQFIWLVLNAHDAEYYLTCAALPLSLIVLVEGHLAARHENKLMMWSFMGGCVAALVYFVYKLVKVLRNKDTDATYGAVWETLTTFSVLAIILLIATFIFACLVMQNFGRGLKAQMSKSTATRRGKSLQLHRGPMATHPNRMSIE